MKNDILIISNEAIHKSDNIYNCENLDLKSIPEALNVKNNVRLLGRTSKLKKNYEINGVDTLISGNILSYLLQIIKINKKYPLTKNFVISISPYTFLACILIFFLKKKPLVYLRSNGFEEYKAILGFIGPLIYSVMFFLVTKISKLISCRKHLLNGNNGEIVSPSHLTNKWFMKNTEVNLKKINLLYIGRLKVEKGIFSLVKILSENNIEDIKLTIVSDKENHHKLMKKNFLKLFDSQSNENLIQFYDECNIFILPSFTEGHPQVLDEALARQRPVLVFNEIAHVKRDREGVFVIERNFQSFKNKIDFIIKNYSEIQSKIRSNKSALPTADKFIAELEDILVKS